MEFGKGLIKWGFSMTEIKGLLKQKVIGWQG
jgi:hypothetical protein